MTELAAQYGISRKTAYKWLERYQADGASGLIDRSRRPRVNPNATDPELVDALLAVRRRHPRWGPKKLLAVARRGEAEGVLTIATVPKDVERGLAMGMELNGARPRFVVNLSAAMGAGASFESSFLALCRIVER